MKYREPWRAAYTKLVFLVVVSGSCHGACSMLLFSFAWRSSSSNEKSGHKETHGSRCDASLLLVR